MSLSSFNKYHLQTIHLVIGLVGWVFANGPGDLGSIPGHIIPKILKILLDTSFA